MQTLGISRPVASRAASTSVWFIALLTSTPAKPAARNISNLSRRLIWSADLLRSVLHMKPFLLIRFAGPAVGPATGAAAAACTARGARAARAAEDFRNARRSIMAGVIDSF